MRYLKAVTVLAALVAAVAPVPAATVELLYSDALYPRLQPIVTAWSSLVPIAMLDLAGGLLLAGVVGVLIHRWRTLRFGPAVGRSLLSAVVLAAVLYLWFLLFWGLNYRRVPLEEKLVYDRARVTRTAASGLAHRAVDQLNGLVSDSTPSAADEEALIRTLADVQRILGATRTTPLAEPKRSLLGYYFRQAAIDGMTNPFFLEIILNPDLLPFERPFVLAHEWAHLSGYADESEANFVAWLACVRATPAAQYSGWLSAYQHLAGQLPREERQALATRLHPAVHADLVAATRRVARSSPAVRSASRGAYDSYLKANRIDEGIANYNAVVRLMLGASLDAGWTPELRR